MMNDYTEKAVIPSHDLFTALLSMLEEGHAAAFTVSGMSMWPLICHGRDQVVVTACDINSLHVGDIILFQTPLGNYMLHRVTALKPDAFETTGDGNCFRDGWFPRECARAKVVSILRDGKKIDCAAPGWRFVFAIWRILFPVRRHLLNLLRGIGNLKAKVRRWKSGK